MPRFDLTSLGESMLRLSVPAGRRLANAARFDAHFGGAEGNVCAAIAGLGRRTGWVSALPRSALGSMALRAMRAAGVDVGAVGQVDGGRLGTYFVELGEPPRGAYVVYDREGSAAAKLQPAAVDWDYLLDTRWLHLTGITPALGEGPAAVVESALRQANDAGVPVSLDVNFRSKLWDAAAARAWLEPRLAHVDLLICGLADARTVFGLTGDPDSIALELAGRARGKAVLTLGDAGAIAVVDGERVGQVEAVPAVVVDRLGAGDAFAAGVLDGVLDGTLPEGLRRGAALAALALAQDGDMLLTDRAEMEAVMAGAARRPSR